MHTTELEPIRWVRDEECYRATPRQVGGTCDCGLPRWHRGPCGSTF